MRRRRSDRNNNRINKYGKKRGTNKKKKGRRKWGWNSYGGRQMTLS